MVVRSREHVPYLSASAVVIHYEEALYQMYAPFSDLISVLYADLLYCAHLQSNTTFQCGSSNGYVVRNVMVCSLCLYSITVLGSVVVGALG